QSSLEAKEKKEIAPKIKVSEELKFLTGAHGIPYITPLSKDDPAFRQWREWSSALNSGHCLLVGVLEVDSVSSYLETSLEAEEKKLAGSPAITVKYPPGTFKLLRTTCLSHITRIKAEAANVAAEYTFMQGLPTLLESLMSISQTFNGG